VSHTIGIAVIANNMATLDGILWFGNGTNTSGTGFITVTNEITGDPAFASDSYHLTANSAAIDKGVDAGVTTDIDGDPRPTGHGYDLGADEFPVRLAVTKQADPNLVQAGAQLTYTLCVTNTGGVDLHAAITDTLPIHVTSGRTSGGTVALPGQPLTWTTFIPISGTWTETVVVTTEPGYAGWLTNVVQVTTIEGAMGADSITVYAGSYRIYLPLVLR